MDAIHDIEILWILFLQSIGEWLRDPMQLISLLGQEEFYMLIMPVLYWSFDAVLGLRMAMMLLLSNSLSVIFKTALHAPRPYWVEPDVRAMAVETSFGIPSGHAQNAASLWGLLAAASRRSWVRAALVFLIFLIGFSRLYLGVHFLSDVLVGWLVGGLLLFAFLKVEPRVAAYLKTRSLPQMVGLALLTSLLLMFLMVITVTAASGYEIPETWQSNALLDDPENFLDPFDLHGAFTVGGTWFGILAGAAWLYHRQGGYDASGTPVQKLLRYIIGVAGIFVLWYLVGDILPRSDDALSYGLRYLRYAMVGLWISAIAPLVFERLNLTRRQPVQTPPLSAPENPL